jgi:hypothetical protein
MVHERVRFPLSSQIQTKLYIIMKTIILDYEFCLGEYLDSLQSEGITWCSNSHGVMIHLPKKYTHHDVWHLCRKFYEYKQKVEDSINYQ